MPVPGIDIDRRACIVRMGAVRVHAVLCVLAIGLGLGACAGANPSIPSRCTAKDAERISVIVNTAVWKNPTHTPERWKTMTLTELDAENHLNRRLIEADMAAIRGDPEKSCQLFRQIAADEHIAIP